MDGENCMFITRDQCEYYRREQKADWQHADDMMIDEMRGLRGDFKELSTTIVKYTTIQAEKDKGNSRFRSDLKYVIATLLSIIGVLVAAGYFLK